MSAVGLKRSVLCSSARICVEPLLRSMSVEGCGGLSNFLPGVRRVCTVCRVYIVAAMTSKLVTCYSSPSALPALAALRPSALTVRAARCTHCAYCTHTVCSAERTLEYLKLIKHLIKLNPIELTCSPAVRA